jgi:hypothetical protein
VVQWSEEQKKKEKCAEAEILAQPLASFCLFVILSFCHFVCSVAPFFSLRPLARPLSVEFTGIICAV